MARESSRSRRKFILVLAMVLGVGVAAALYWFEPQKLVLDDEVDEALPSASAPAGTEGRAKDGSQAQKSPMTVASGRFRGLAHHGEGVALLIETNDGTFLRFEDFEVENGPDLKVYLSESPADADESALVESYLDLGDLKGNIGDQNYVIPSGTDLSDYRSAVIWCRRFSVGFAVAPLS